MKEAYHNSFLKLKSYCEDENFKGWDPYDGLNSNVFQRYKIFSKSRLARLIWIQIFKRNPINLRRIFSIEKGYNPKGLGLFIIGYCNLYKTDPKKEYLNKINLLCEKVISLKSKGYSGACWGYNFDWQARAFFQPKYTPTVVATTFIAEALIEAHKVTANESYLKIAVSSADFVLKDLNRSYDESGNFSFSYSPLDSTQVFNASLLGVKLLMMVYKYTRNEELKEEALKAVKYVCERQKADGSWSYGTLPYHQWVDNFHTGYNLECIHLYQKVSSDVQFRKNIKIGLEYYLNNFFTKEGKSKYYNTKTYPIDVHAPAQLIVTLYKLNIIDQNRELLDRVIDWTISHLQDNRGYFYYQKRKLLSSKIPYIRWAQAWMFYGLSYYLRNEEGKAA